jgi:hypothetical protein
MRRTYPILHVLLIAAMLVAAIAAAGQSATLTGLSLRAPVVAAL